MQNALDQFGIKQLPILTKNSFRKKKDLNLSYRYGERAGILSHGFTKH